MKNFIVTFTALTFIVGLIFIPPVLQGQNISKETESLAGQILNAWKTSDDIQHGYSWNSRVDVTKEGKVMDIMISLYRYGPDGKMVQTVLNDEHAALPSSFLIHKIAEEEKDKIVTFLQGAHDQILQYYMKTEQKLMPFLGKAQIISNEAEGNILLSADNVIQQGDKLTWWISPVMHTTNKLSVTTSYQGDQIEFTGTFTTLKNGLNYMTFGEALIPSKGYTIMIHNYDYVKQE